MKTKLASLFIALLVLSAIMGWLTGYNFDQRDESVAIWAFMSVVLAFFVTLIFHDYLEDRI